MRDFGRVVFLDYLRVIAIFMVMLVHSCEQFYFGPDGGFLVASRSAAWWVILVDSACRASVPLFVMASAYLLFPVTRPTGSFLARRILRVCVPFVLWCCVYTAWNGGSWRAMLFNFPAATGGHLWFVPMLLGLYLLMPLLSPWAERVSSRELLGWLGVWLFTTAFPYLRLLWGHLFGCGWAHVAGLADFGKVPFLYGECAWNSFGTFHYVSGFVGYLLLGFWFRRFAADWSWRKTLFVALPLWAAGWLVVALPFYFRMAKYGTEFPLVSGYAAAVDLEMSWEFCSTGVAMTVVAYFLIIRKLVSSGLFYRFAVRPLSEASYGVYLMHILILVPVCAAISQHVSVPVAIFGTALATFSISSVLAYAVHRVPVVGKWLVG